MRDRADSVKQYYRESGHACRYDEVRFTNAGGKLIDAWEKDIVSEFLEGHPLGEPVLEVATGTGRFSLMLARQGHAVTAVDSSSEMLDQLNETAATEGLAITCVHADAFNLPFVDGAFHTVFSIRFVWHFKAMDRIVSELVRVSSKHVVFDLMNKASFAALTAPLANHIFYRSLHTELMTRREARRLLRSSGLRPVAEKAAFAFPYICYRRMPAIAKPLFALDQVFLRWLPMGTALYFKAEKDDGGIGQDGST